MQTFVVKAVFPENLISLQLHLIMKCFSLCVVYVVDLFTDSLMVSLCGVLTVAVFFSSCSSC